MHKDAPLAHLASVAAQQQGRFWEFHDRLFEGFPKMGRADLSRYAREAGLDMSRFERDLLSARLQQVVRDDLQELSKLGVTGTPAFFVNGRFLSGAQPYERFAEIIDAELQKLGVPAPDAAR